MAKDMYQKRKERQENKNMETKEEKKVNINWYPGHMAKTKRLIKEKIGSIDIVYELIDARMPKSSKIIDIDEVISDKPRILIMTKVDLCDINETNKWIKYYEEKGYNVLPLNIEKNTNIKPLINLTKKVMEEKNKKRTDKGMTERKARVLVVGIPNVGKSTLINRLSGKKATVTGNKPGVTKSVSWIRINNDVELLDTPGILWPKLDENNSYNLAALSAIKEEILPLYELSSYILETLYKYYPDKLKERYNIDDLDEDMVSNLEYIGKKRGCLISGGDIDYDKVMTLIINDVKLGHIKEITFDRMETNE